MHIIGGVVLVIWLIIGVTAASDRGYFDNSAGNCSKTSDTFITVIAGPLNYIGVNPKVNCTAPQPSN
jgi:hypothetical protein